MTIKPAAIAMLAGVLGGCDQGSELLRVEKYQLEDVHIAEITSKTSGDIGIESVAVNKGSCSARFVYKLHFPVPADQIPVKLGSGDSIQLMTACEMSSLQVNTDRGSFTYKWN